MRYLVVLAALGSLAMGSLVGGGLAEPSSSRGVIDRTVSCSVGVHAGVREIDVLAVRGTRKLGNRAAWQTLPYVEARDPSTLHGALADLAAGGPLAPEQGRVDNHERLGIGTACKASSTKLAFSGGRLSRQTVSPFGDRYSCPVSTPVLVRVRGVFRTPSSLKRNGTLGELRARGTLVQGSVAIRTHSGKPVLFATVEQSGTTRLYLARTCTSD